jgi:aspartate carbamoyltransferase catalytic subunit
VDNDPRAAYFRQVENGKFVRMALIYTLLKWAEEQPAEGQTPRLDATQVHNDWRCSNRQCVSATEDVDHLFHATEDGYRCAYCEARVK